MASEPSSIAKMILQYEWILENVEEEPKTFATKMILFRGERVFRVGLKNLLVKSPVLFLMAVDLNKIGMKVEEVMYGIQESDTGPSKMLKMGQKNIGDDDGNLQLFTIELSKQIVGKCTFVFRICIEGSVPGYSYRLSDRLAKDQLWEAAKNKNSVDNELVVKGEKFYAHKAILAARSPVFAAEFTKEQPVGNGHHQIRIDDVEPSTVEQFLHFIYTGESLGTLANEDLLKLAEQYQLTTLSSLCRVALKEFETTQIVNLTRSLRENAGKPYTFTIRPEKDTEIYFDRTTPTFRCSSSFLGSESGKSKCLMQYQNEDIFLAFFSGGTLMNADEQLYKRYISKPVIHFLCSKHRRFGFKIEDVYSKHGRYYWSKMEQKHFQKNTELLLHFTAQSESNFRYQRKDDLNERMKKEYLSFTFCSLVIFDNTISFDVKTVSTIGHYYYEVMDDAWMKDFWFAATEQKFTDVEIFVGTVKLMEVHQIILSARSPVLNAAFNKISDTGKPALITFGAEFDVDIVKYFLQFLYTGFLETSASKSTNYKQLLKLAAIYEVETLKNFCQLVNRTPPDVEEFTDCLLQL